MKRGLSSSARALLVGALGGAALLAVSSCKDEPGATEILLTIKSRSLPVTRLEIRARTISYDEALLDRDISDRNIVVEPLVILIEPSTIATTDPNTGFLVRARGTVGDAQALGREKLFFVPNQRVEYTIELVERYDDADLDGFYSCRSDSSAECDCDDQNPQVNDFSLERCDDNTDNDCSGYPPDDLEGCRCSFDQPCTPLPPEQWQLAGIGVCKLGVLRCIDGQLAERCEMPADAPYGGFPNAEEIAANGQDDDCDGAVDEGSPCSGVSRPCFLGLVASAAVERARPPETARQSPCRVGSQACESTGWAPTCVGEERPQAIPNGVGWRELTDQCDGLDNDCDGAIDEESYFDADGDGFTGCGTCNPSVPKPQTDGAPWLCEDDKDCNDQALPPSVAGDPCHNEADRRALTGAVGCVVVPGGAEDCSTSWDDDCRCDHEDDDGVADLGLPKLRLDDSSRCLEDVATLDCGRTERDDPTNPGICSDAAGGSSSYYFGFFSDAVCGDCFYCDKPYGLQCSLDGDCSTKIEDCELASCDARSLVPAETRPFCCTPQAGSCSGTSPALWDCPSGSDPCEECPARACDGSQGGRYYYDVLDLTTDGEDNPLCFLRDIVPGSCNGAGACQSEQAECCSAGRGAPDMTRPICRRPRADSCGNPSCTDGPAYDFVLAGQDPYGDCPGTCDGAGACNAQQGEPCGPGMAQCEGGLYCVDGVCCGTPTCPTCSACNVAGAEGGCSGITAAEGRGCNDDCTHCSAGSCVNRPVGAYDECAGSCQACTSAGGNCGNWSGAAASGCADPTTFCCAGVCVDPIGSPSEYGGACGSGDCAGGTWGCSAAVARCSSYNLPCDSCSVDARIDATCTADGGATCGSGTSSACPACQSCLDGGATTSCVATGGAINYGAFTDDTSGTASCTGTQTCDGAGGCKLDFGQPCGVDGTLCASGFCVDGVCCQSASCGSCQSCNGALPGSCSAITAANDPDSCNDDCTHCVSGVCQNRGVGDYAECAGTCQACTTAGGNCGAYSGTAGSACTAAEQFCCAGSCITNPDPGRAGDEYNASCGNGDCAGGTWGCAGAAPRCSSYGGGCDFCQGDNRRTALCTASFGAACDTAAAGTVGCSACRSCLDNGALSVCDGFYAQGDADPTSPNTCSGANACDGAGSCKLANGQGCSLDSDCASGACRADFDGTGAFCAQSANHCVLDQNSDAFAETQVASGSTGCGSTGADAWGTRSCGAGGVWGGTAASCGNYTCASASACATNCGADDNALCIAAAHCKEDASLPDLCVPDLPGNPCDQADEECSVVGACKVDWDGSGTFCAQSANHCVLDQTGDGLAETQVAAGTSVCGQAAGAFGTRTCSATGGTWGGVSSCGNYTCFSGSICNTSCETDSDALCIAAAHCKLQVGNDTCELDTTGNPCDAGSECVSGSCADGFCCAGACSASCQACSSALTGLPNGTCGPLASEGDDANATTPCAAGSGGCGGTDCTCEAGSGLCKRDVGQSCGASSSLCANGNCVDTYCCASACNGTCKSCNAAEQENALGNGLCDDTASGLDPDNDCPGSQLCDGAGGCN